jgi:hypothetical protein
VKRLVSFLAWGCLAMLAARGQTDPALREEGVLYLEGNVPGKVMATVKAPTTLYLRRDFQMVLAVLNPGQSVEVVGSSAEGYLLKGTARNNTVEGWVHPEDLPTGFDSTIFERARKNEEQQAAVAVAIANKTVIRGMTPDEVEQAVGHPTETASRSDAHGSSLTWIFTTYREEPQYTYAIDPFGRPLLQTYYVKIPVGQLVVSFEGGTVASVEEHTSDPNSPGVVTN